MTQIFISYSRKDIAFARRLAGDLENAGYTVWWDITDLRGGDDWVRVIPEAIAASEFFIVVLSPNSTASEWVRKEYTQALSLRKRIIPIMLEATAVPFALNTINFIDFTSEEEYAARLNALLRDLGYSGEPVVPVAPLQLTVRRLALPILVSVLVLLVLGAVFVFNPPVPSSPTSTLPTLTATVDIPTIPAETATPSATATSPSATSSITETATPTRVPTDTPTPTATATAVREPVPYCVRRNLDVTYGINVRRDPSQDNDPFENGLQLGKCLYFQAFSEDKLWLLVANADDQSDPEVRQFAGGWIQLDLLLVPTDRSSINLPVFTLTPTPIPSDTATITPTLTPSVTPTFTPTDMPLPTETDTPTP